MRRRPSESVRSGANESERRVRRGRGGRSGFAACVRNAGLTPGRGGSSLTRIPIHSITCVTSATTNGNYKTPTTPKPCGNYKTPTTPTCGGRVWRSRPMARRAGVVRGIPAAMRRSMFGGADERPCVAPGRLLDQPDVAAHPNVPVAWACVFSSSRTSERSSSLASSTAAPASVTAGGGSPSPACGSPPAACGGAGGGSLTVAATAGRRRQDFVAGSR